MKGFIVDHFKNFILKRSTLIFVLFLYSTNSMISGQNIADSLLSQLESSSIDSNKAEILNELAKISFDKEQYEQAFLYCSQSAVIYHQLGDKSNESYALNNMANILVRMRQYNEAEKYYLIALDIKKDIGDKRGEALVYSNLADNCYEQHKFEKGIEYISNC